MGAVNGPRPPGAPGASAGPGTPGRVLRVAGPLVETTYLPGTAMHDLLALGPSGLTGEVVALRGDTAVVQAYEYTGGLAPGDPVRPGGGPLAAPLGPGLLGGVFDGLLRPLAGAPERLVPGAAPAPDRRRWRFRPLAAEGDRATGGGVLGEVTGPVAGPDGGAAGPGPVPLPVLVPPGCGGPVRRIAPEGAYPADAVLAVVGGAEVPMTVRWPVRRPRPVRGRTGTREPLRTGQRVLDLLFPVVRGGTAAVPGGFGTGKTVLLQQIAKWCDADVIVHVGCGERGNEMADVIDELAALEDPRTGGLLADRTVVLATTSDMPMMAREAAVHTGATVAEYFRDAGLDVVLIADSTSRWAEALREFASRSGELPAEEGYPAGLASRLAAFYERAGAVTTLGGRPGSVTVVGAVSPPGGDTAEPVTAQTERFVRCLWTLDPDLAHARHYPAVSWSGSFSRDAAAVGAGQAAAGDPDWAGRRARTAALLAGADRLAGLVDLVGVTALPAAERMTVLGGRLLREAVLQQSALSPNDAHCSAAKTAALAEAVLAVAGRCRELAAAGTPPADVEEADFGPLLRAREETGPDDASGVAARRDAVLAALAALGGGPR
ncbi:V-type ATP synthase subunit A [Streptacidiphilus sp. ASG 303]|uniref:V-type ATP synthase subunit A n=1 Tax=Streptacidiphilus sp. ASG 303 TaxID=2896847 RepID=UPI001E5DEBE3|nr:V-type ATP synthase subunit A [Streptacidiphilus sp. ASG 303]MCD0484522.1 V-type ATP synthase subunit A [Streptacidiphilus sp. ASG 303]